MRQGIALPYLSVSAVKDHMSNRLILFALFAATELGAYCWITVSGISVMDVILAYFTSITLITLSAYFFFHRYREPLLGFLIRISGYKNLWLSITPDGRCDGEVHGIYSSPMRLAENATAVRLPLGGLRWQWVKISELGWACWKVRLDRSVMSNKDPIYIGLQVKMFGLSQPIKVSLPDFLELVKNIRELSKLYTSQSGGEVITTLLAYIRDAKKERNELRVSAGTALCRIAKEVGPGSRVQKQKRLHVLQHVEVALRNINSVGFANSISTQVKELKRELERVTEAK